jgi:hypothetical protein
MTALPGFHNISTFIGKFKGGTRPNRFRISGSNIALPAGSGGLFRETHCQAATLPESIVGIIPIPFRGRIYKFPGDRTYNEWNVTVLDDIGDQATWQFFHNWSNLFNSHDQNVSDDRAQKKNYCQDLMVELLDHNENKVIRKMLLQNAWPVQVGPVTLDMNAGNQLGSFQVQIAYTHFTQPAVPVSESDSDFVGPPSALA